MSSNDDRSESDDFEEFEEINGTTLDENIDDYWNYSDENDD